MPKKTKQSNKETDKHYQPGCHTCNGLCCRHIALEIDRPTTKNDFDNIRWYLMHEKVQVGIDLHNNWLIEVATPCRHLKADHRCGAYEKRPELCRAYPGKEESCEHEDKRSTYKLLFVNDTELERWMKKKRPSWKF
jgi:Fe-S-cluster containining protein